MTAEVIVEAGVRQGQRRYRGPLQGGQEAEATASQYLGLLGTRAASGGRLLLLHHHRPGAMVVDQ